MTPLHIDPKNHTPEDLDSYQLSEQLFSSSLDTLADKIDLFARFSSRKSLARFLARYHLFQKILNVNGSIVECGVLSGQGLFTFAKLSSILEPYNHTRKVIGFDTFEGFPSADQKDIENSDSSFLQDFKPGALSGCSFEELLESIKLFDLNRPLNHIKKIELVKGDLCKTAEDYVESNKHLIVSMLYLDVDLYQPTMAALKSFVPLMPKGAIIAFDELNLSEFPGETQALNEYFGIQNVHLNRFTIDPAISYITL
jgi:hypothetical protein